MLSLQFTRRFSMAHRLLSDRRSKCVVPHGHNEFVRATLTSPATPTFGAANMQASFDQLKKRWHGWIDDHVDHAFQVNARDPLIEHFLKHEPDVVPRLMVFDGDPTTEALAYAFWRKLNAFLKEDAPEFRVARIEIEETPTNTVSLDDSAWSAAEAAWSPGAWCDRPDMTINDLIPPAERAVLEACA